MITLIFGGYQTTVNIQRGDTVKQIHLNAKQSERVKKTLVNRVVEGKGKLDHSDSIYPGLKYLNNQELEQDTHELLETYQLDVNNGLNALIDTVYQIVDETDLHNDMGWGQLPERISKPVNEVKELMGW